MSERTDQARGAALFELYTGAVADILDELGARQQCLPADVRPLLPRIKIAGPVFTTREREDVVRDALDRGGSIRELFEKHRVF